MMICIVFNLYDHIIVIEYRMYRFIVYAYKIRPDIKTNFNGFENRYVNVRTYIAFGLYVGISRNCIYHFNRKKQLHPVTV